SGSRPSSISRGTSGIWPGRRARDLRLPPTAGCAALPGAPVRRLRVSRFAGIGRALAELGSVELPVLPFRFPLVIPAMAGRKTASRRLVVGFSSDLGGPVSDLLLRSSGVGDLALGRLADVSI